MSAYCNESEVQYKSLDYLGFPNYCVGDDGSVWRELKPFKNNKTGHLSVKLSRGNKQKAHQIHVLVLLSFVGPKLDGQLCRHLDGNPKNNKLENLCWGTPKENRMDMIRHGTVYCGERHHYAKLTAVEVIEIRRLYTTGGFSLNQLADRFVVDFTTIWQIVKRKTWKRI